MKSLTTKCVLHKWTFYDKFEYSLIIHEAVTATWTDCKMLPVNGCIQATKNVYCSAFILHVNGLSFKLIKKNFCCIIQFQEHNNNASWFFIVFPTSAFYSILFHFFFIPGIMYCLNEKKSFFLFVISYGAEWKKLMIFIMTALFFWSLKFRQKSCKSFNPLWEKLDLCFSLLRGFYCLGKVSLIFWKKDFLWKSCGFWGIRVLGRAIL